MATLHRKTLFGGYVSRYGVSCTFVRRRGSMV